MSCEEFFNNFLWFDGDELNVCIVPWDDDDTGFWILHNGASIEERLDYNEDYIKTYYKYCYQHNILHMKLADDQIVLYLDK